MSVATRFTLCFLLLLGLCSFASGQAGNTTAAAAVAGGVPDLGQSLAPIQVQSAPVGVPYSSIVLDGDTGAVISGGQGASVRANASSNNSGNDDDFDIDHPRPNVPTIAGLNSVATFDGAFFAQAGPSSQGTTLFRWTMVGNDPRIGGTTVIPIKVDEVSLQLLNPDGSVNMVVPFAPFEQDTLESPDFEPLDYRSGANIEYDDAVHRAQFFHIMKNDWHTILIPKVVNRVTLQVPATVNVSIKGVTTSVPTYFTGTAGDGSTFVLMLSSFFDNVLFSNEVVNEINAGNFATNAMNLVMFPNTYLFNLNRANPQQPGSCCVLGFHTYFNDETTVPQPRWLTQYVSWISPGIFGGGFQDVTALSHELAETFADPFVDNATPSWQFPGQPAASTDCQANLEEGDPIEVLANATASIEVKERHFDFIYHPQNIPLLQWFEMGPTSDAIDGAFSFPDETVLTHSAIPCP